jgi:hypothetical protein
MSWRTPTKYLQRLGDAMALLCAGNRPPDEMLGAWLNECDDDNRLQEFACEFGPAWAQGIAVIDAAQLLADQPTEILCIDGPQIDHEMREPKGAAEARHYPEFRDLLIRIAATARQGS